MTNPTIPEPLVVSSVTSWVFSFTRLLVNSGGEDRSFHALKGPVPVSIRMSNPVRSHHLLVVEAV